MDPEDVASVAEIELQLRKIKLRGSNSSSRSASLSSSSSSSSLSNSNNNLNDITDTVDELWKLKHLVDRKSRLLPMSNEERKKFNSLTSQYFSELSNALKKETAGSSRHSRTLQEQEIGDCEVNEVTDDEAETRAAAAKIISQALAASQRTSGQESPSQVHDSDSEKSEEEKEEEEEDMQGSSSNQEQFEAFLPTNSWVSDENSDEYRQLINATQEYFSNDTEYLDDLSISNLQSLVMRQLVYGLEVANFQAASKSHDQSIAEEFQEALIAIDSISSIRFSPRKHFALVDAIFHKRFGLEKSAEHLENYLDTKSAVPIAIACKLLTKSVDKYIEKILEIPLSEPLEFPIGECNVCFLKNQVLYEMSCCHDGVCFNCISRWVTDKVFSRSIPVGCPCCDNVIKNSEVVEILGDKCGRYYEILADLNKDSNQKTCPRCNMLAERPTNRRKSKKAGGLVVQCNGCHYPWCFTCHGPMHQGVSCRVNQSGKYQLREWSSETYPEGSEEIRKARKCPSCKVFIEKNLGCNHMTCTCCHFEFCYVCGKNWRAGNVVFGRHSSRFSIFGCKQKLLPKRPMLRKLIRGTLLILETLGICIFSPIALALIVALSPILGIVGIGILIYKCKK